MVSGKWVSLLLWMWLNWIRRPWRCTKHWTAFIYQWSLSMLSRSAIGQASGVRHVLHMLDEERQSEWMPVANIEMCNFDQFVSHASQAHLTKRNLIFGVCHTLGSLTKELLVTHTQISQFLAVLERFSSSIYIRGKGDSCMEQPIRELYFSI